MYASQPPTMPKGYSCGQMCSVDKGADVKAGANAWEYAQDQTVQYCTGRWRCMQQTQVERYLSRRNRL